MQASMTVTGAIDTGESVSINVYEPAAGSFAANNTTGSSNGLTVTLAGGAAINCSDIPGADGIINVSVFTASTGGTISGTFSGTVSECSPAVGGGVAVSLVDGSFSCQANEQRQPGRTDGLRDTCPPISRTEGPPRSRPLGTGQIKKPTLQRPWQPSPVDP